MKTLFINIDSLVTVASDGKPSKRGSAMQDIGEIRNGAMLVSDRIEWIGNTADWEYQDYISSEKPDSIIDLKGKTVLPGFVDSHSHIVFAGDRSGEFARRMRGVTYQHIAAEGGGILSTMKATRLASTRQLADSGLRLAQSALAHGSTSIEIKSGYGLDTATEMNMLRAIRIIESECPIRISRTFLGAHDFPPEFAGRRDEYVDLLVSEMIPEAAGQGLAEFCDVFVDEGYYTIGQAERIFNAAARYGLKARLHADEMANVHATELAVKLGALSADHLLNISSEGIEAIAGSDTIATLLPGTAYFLRMQYAPARKLIEAGAAVALATDCNPGSCFTENMQLILSLAVINMKMSAEEAITAATLNGAASLGKSSETGSLEVGKLADFIVCDVDSYSSIFYHFGVNHVEQTWIGGRKAYGM